MSKWSQFEGEPWPGERSPGQDVNPFPEIKTFSEDALLAADWISPAFVAAAMAAGYTVFQGAIADMMTLEGQGIKCFMPFEVAFDGSYLWGVLPADAYRAKLLLGVGG